MDAGEFGNIQWHLLLEHLLDVLAHMVYSLARFIGTHCSEHIQLRGEVRDVLFKKAPRSLVSYLKRKEMKALLASPDRGVVDASSPLDEYS